MSGSSAGGTGSNPILFIRIFAVDRRILTKRSYLEICLTAYVFLERDRWALRGPLGSGRWRAARGQDALTAAAVAAQPFDESSTGRVRRYRAARHRFSCQQPDVAAPRALNSHSLLGTHAKHPIRTPDRQPRQLALALDFCKCSGFVRGTRAERAGPAQTPERRSLFHC